MSNRLKFAEHLAAQAGKQLGIRVQPSTLDEVLYRHVNPGPELERGAEHLIDATKGHGYTWDVNTMFILLAKIDELEKRLEQVDRVPQAIAG